MKKQATKGLLLITLIVGLARCQARPDVASVAHNELNAIPLPVDSLMLTEKAAVMWGADDQCYLGQAEGLFGTRDSLSALIRFYSEYAHSRGWIVKPALPQSPTLLLIKSQDRSYTVAVTHMTRLVPPFNKYPSTLLDERLIDDALSKFDIVYMLSVSYREPNHIAHCDGETMTLQATP